MIQTCWIVFVYLIWQLGHSNTSDLTRIRSERLQHCWHLRSNWAYLTFYSWVRLAFFVFCVHYLVLVTYSEFYNCNYGLSSFVSFYPWTLMGTQPNVSSISGQGISDVNKIHNTNTKITNPNDKSGRMGADDMNSYKRPGAFDEGISPAQCKRHCQLIPSQFTYL